MNTAKDLSKEAPTSPRIRVGGYAILARAADKGRADLAGICGGYHLIARSTISSSASKASLETM
ncbi:MAG: DUF5069 domain-containing protein [Akkermansiaceae bacterium]|nr:DUF5069 domain-containing protein [Akkermansiaceae bacterium]